jgi:hypothetical protein
VLRLSHSVMLASIYREAKIIILMSYMKTLSYNSLTHCIGTQNFQCILLKVRFSLLVNGLVMVAQMVQITVSRGGIIREQQTATDWLGLLPRFLFGAKKE